MTSCQTVRQHFGRSPWTTAGLLLGGVTALGATAFGAPAQELILTQVELTPTDIFEQFQSVERIDDLDGDGAPDFVVSVPRRYLEFGPGAGGYGVLEARSSRTGQVLWTLENSAIDFDLGHSMRAIGDVDGDGYEDLAVTLLDFGFFTFPGINSVAIVSAQTGFILYDKPLYGYVMMADLPVASVGDVDGDGRDDWVLMDFGRGGAESLKLFSGATGIQLAGLVGDFGSVMSLDDMNGDGIDDIAVGALGTGSAGTQPTGSVQIRSGQNLTLIHTIDGSDPGSGFGTRVLLLDDLDGDGLPDLFVASSASFPGVRATVVSYATGATLREFNAPLARIIDGLSLVSDRDSDGIRDIAVGDPFANMDGIGATSSIRFYSPASGLEIDRIEGGAGDDYFGHSLTSAGDVDGDGVDELLYAVLNSVNGRSRAEIRQVRSADYFWYCGGAPANSTGAPGRVAIAGSPSSTASTLRLLATDLPPMSFGFFIVSETPESSPATSGLGARVCVGGAIGRLIGPGQVQSTGTQGQLNAPMDLSMIPSPTGFVPPPILGSLYVQAWYRDLLPTGALTSHLSDAFSFVVLP